MNDKGSIFCKLEKKYRPSKIEDIIGNKFAISKIKKWLDNYEINKVKQMNNPKKRKKLIIKKDSGENIDLESDTEPSNIGEKDEIPVEESVEIQSEEPTEKKITIPHQNDELFSCLLVMGHHGSGKSSAVNAILNSLKYNVKKINLNKISSSKKLAKLSMNKKNDNFIDDYVNKLIKGDHIYNSLLSNTKKKKIFFLFW